MLKCLYWLAAWLTTARVLRFRRKPRLVLVLLLHHLQKSEFESFCLTDLPRAFSYIRPIPLCSNSMLSSMTSFTRCLKANIVKRTPTWWHFAALKAERNPRHQREIV